MSSPRIKDSVKFLEPITMRSERAGEQEDSRAPTTRISNEPHPEPSDFPTNGQARCAWRRRLCRSLFIDSSSFFTVVAAAARAILGWYPLTAPELRREPPPPE